MNRRGFLGVLARAPVVGAIAGKVMAEQATAQIAGVSIGGLTGNAQGCAPSSIGDTSSRWRQALTNLVTRQQVETILYEDERCVSRIDPDIAAMRSFSLNAKVAYQRQRNVEHRLSLMQGEWPWARLENLLSRSLGLRL